MRINLLPFPAEPEFQNDYIDYNFKRITDALAQQENTATYVDVAPGPDITSVTGTRVLSTGLRVVTHVVASLRSVPVAGGCIVRAIPTGTKPGDITLFVYSNAFALSVIPVDVEWIATGAY
jgi:hypothetical protein